MNPVLASIFVAEVARGATWSTQQVDVGDPVLGAALRVDTTGRLVTAYGDDSVYFAVQKTTGWSVELVDTQGCARPIALALDSTGQVAAFGFADGTLKLFDLWNPQERASTVVNGQPLALSFSQHKSTLRLAIGTSADRIELRDASELDKVLFDQLIDSQPRCVAASGDLVAVGMVSGTVETWSIRDTRCARYPKGHTYEVERIALLALRWIRKGDVPLLEKPATQIELSTEVGEAVV